MGVGWSSVGGRVFSVEFYVCFYFVVRCFFFVFRF